MSRDISFARCASVAALFAGISATSAAQGSFLFDTVYHGQSALTPGGDTLTAVDQVVALDDGSVAALLRFGSTTAVALNSGGDALVNAVASAGQTIYGGGATFDSFYNLGAANGRLTFAGYSTANAYGLFRYDAGAGTQQQRIFYEGDALGGGPATLDVTGGGSVPSFGVNKSGSVALGAAQPNAAGNQLLAQWNNGDTSPAVLLDQTAPQSEYNSPTFLPNKSMTSTGAAVFAADEAGTRRIFGIDSGSPAAQQRVADSFTIGSSTYEPFMVLGATGTASTGATLFQAFKDSSTLSLVMKTTNGSAIELGTFNGSGPYAAEMSANGRAAAYIPTANGGKIVYLKDDISSTAPTTIVAVNDAIDGGYTISNLPANGTAPMVNDNGVVVFEAEITDGSNNQFEALLIWSEGAASPTVVIKSGDAVTVNGNGVTVASFSTTGSPFNPNTPYPGLTLDADGLKDGLSDTNQLAFGVLYDGTSGLESAVLVTSLPEPGMVSALAVFAAGALLRRRNR